MDDAPAPDRYIEVGLAVAHPWLCDAMGHLNTRHSMGMFDDAAWHLFAHLGYDPRAAAEDGWGWADVRHEIDYSGELGVGALIRIEGAVTAVGRSSITARYRMLDRQSGGLCATLIAKTVCFDLTARKGRDVPAPIREAIRTAFGVS